MLEIKRLSSLSAYLLALLLVAVATVVRVVLESAFDIIAPFITFYPAVVLAVLFGGMGPALLTIGLSGFIASLLVHEPQNPMKLLVTLATFCFTGVFLTIIAYRLERGRAEQLRKESEERRVVGYERDRLMTLIDSMSDGVWLTDAKGNVLLVNPVGKQQCVEVGLDPNTVYGPSSPALLSQVEVTTADGRPIGMETLTKILQGEPLRQLEIRVANRAGGPTFYRRLSANVVKHRDGQIVGAVVVVQDMTAQKHAEEEKARLEEQLRESQKMEALGTLAGGVAHDFNNMLAVVLGNAELALDDLTGTDGPRRNIEQIVKASKRATDLVKQILAFSRKTDRGRNALNLVTMLEETRELLRGSLPTTIRIDLDLRTERPTVIADPSQIQQVLINLASNGAYAMRKDGGVLAISLSDVTVKQRGQIPEAELAPGTYVKLSVQDTGTGMPEEVRRRVFEPFFTTKEPGQGSGMGLAVVLTDQTMPEITGVALAKKMLEVRKDMRIILFTGYTEAVSPEQAKAVGIREFVMKPIGKRQVAETIRRVLDS